MRLAKCVSSDNTMYVNTFHEVDESAVMRARILESLVSGKARLIRRRSGISQADVAKSLGASRSAVASWEQGRRRPRGEVALRYAGLLAGLVDVFDRTTSEEA